nr:hypothetical protein [Tanacetum cinerariifolium]
MDTTQAQQKALDDSLVAPANHLKIRKCNLQLISTLKSKEPTLQVATNSIHHTSLRFKMNGKSHTVNVDNFRDMLQIFPKLPGQKFKDPPFEKEILSFNLGHTEEIKTTQIYDAILAKHLTNQAMIESEAYKTYFAYNTSEKTPKPKYVQKKADFETSPKKKPIQAPKGKQLKAIAKVPKSGKKKLHAQGLETLSKIALSKAEQMKIETKISKTQFHSSHASGSGAHEGTGVSPGVLDVPTYGSDDEHISWKSSDDEDDGDASNQSDDDEDDDGQDDDNE